MNWWWIKSNFVGILLFGSVAFVGGYGWHKFKVAQFKTDTEHNVRVSIIEARVEQQQRDEEQRKQLEAAQLKVLRDETRKSTELFTKAVTEIAQIDDHITVVEQEIKALDNPDADFTHEQCLAAFNKLRSLGEQINRRNPE